jgi:hypothetical protein
MMKKLVSISVHSVWKNSQKRKSVTLKRNYLPLYKYVGHIFFAVVTPRSNTEPEGTEDEV